MALQLFIRDEPEGAPWACELPADATVADLLAEAAAHQGVHASSLTAELPGQGALSPSLTLADAGVCPEAVVLVRDADRSLVGVTHWFCTAEIGEEKDDTVYELMEYLEDESWSGSTVVFGYLATSTAAKARPSCFAPTRSLAGLTGIRLASLCTTTSWINRRQGQRTAASSEVSSVSSSRSCAEWAARRRTRGCAANPSFS
eukprot:TRINITY_DN30665_c0_g1_i3.p1 TRINITY_DN30665_c0_g1~~TRINITY_DN30665_c0_g1_i3.p1  ORF type:complete len:202 (+),score=17.15 TRINITY_DN30665_c0_g1_i3:99-704(+)